MGCLSLFSLAPLACLGAASAAGMDPAFDLDRDGRVGAGDAQALFDSVSSGRPVDRRFDFDGDGAAGIADAWWFARWAEGLGQPPRPVPAPDPLWRGPIDSALAARYAADVEAKAGWGAKELGAAYPFSPQPPPKAPAKGYEYESRVLDAFERNAHGRFDKAAFRDRVRKQGLAVSEAAAFPNYFQALDWIHSADLPLLFTSDALLHTVYLSYDKMLTRLEEEEFIPALEAMLGGALAYARKAYRGDPAGADAEELLGTALLLLKRGRGDVAPTRAMTRHLKDIDALAMAEVPLWGRDSLVDFSQFRPRGHYAESPELSAYFQAMTWLSRADIAFDLRPQDPRPNPALTRMKRDAIAVWDCLVASGGFPAWSRMDRDIGYLVGAPDGLDPRGMGKVLQELGAVDVAAFLKAFPEARFDSVMARGRFGAQAILSQAKSYGGAGARDHGLSPIFSFMPQRFILDSYTFSQLTFPITPDPWPSPLQVAFVLGDNSALKDLPVTTGAYGARLAAQRALYDGIAPAGWGSDLYAGWLGFLRALNGAEANPKAAPVFRTAAWRAKMRNTQLASWAQLRHNTVLYAKESYAGSVLCVFPKAYVEPYPDFFAAMAAYAKRGGDLFRGRDLALDRYFDTLGAVCGRLRDIAGRTAAGQGPTRAQEAWLRDALTTRDREYGCGGSSSFLDGWYLGLVYGLRQKDLKSRRDFTIVDVHTKPLSDDLGAAGVLHVGTGPIRLAAVAIPVDGCAALYVGPVSSFYETRIGADLHRLTDEEWKARFASKDPPAPPAWLKPILVP